MAPKGDESGEPMIKRFYELQEKILSYYPEANLELLKKAYTIATDAHQSQLRASKEPYMVHPLSVASILADLRLDEISIAAGLLHDVIEDSPYTREDLEKRFGKEIADIVWGVTKISKISTMDVVDAQAETLKKMIVAMTGDIRVILIKLADRLHNVRTLAPFREEKRKKIARETLEIYAPIAYRLGMGKIKDELEDCSFMYLYPEEFKRISAEVDDRHDWVIAQLEALKTEVGKILADYHIHAETEYRIKRPISIYRKLQRQNIDLDRVYDLLAMRVITDTVANCYAIMGAIHQRWPHIPARWRDFITTPKSNQYRSIHTTIITPEGVKFEIQIRTFEMHQVSEEGIAAHWKYKEGLGFLDNDTRLEWFRDMIEHHRTNPDPKEFLTSVKKDLTPNEIYVFTPKGKVINLKGGATPIDFAYSIHSEVGDHCKSAVVNEKMVPLRTVLNSGDVVEILTAKNCHPSADWLKHVITIRAKRRIAAYLQKIDNVRLAERGKRLMSRVVREYHKKHKLVLGDGEMERRIVALHYPDAETFFRDLGAGKRPLDRPFLQALFPEIQAPAVVPVAHPGHRTDPLHRAIVVEGIQDLEFSLAKCCSPIKGEAIVGYVTASRGLVIHKKGCPSVAAAVPLRLKEASWSETGEVNFLVRYDLTVLDRPGTLTAITAVNAAHDSNIKKVEQEQINQNTARVALTFEVRDQSQLHEIEAHFLSTEGVIHLNRRRLTSR